MFKNSGLVVVVVYPRIPRLRKTEVFSPSSGTMASGFILN
jgi:hypothetical protein